MKTVGTKLDNKDYEKFLEMCNNDGMSVSEELRDLVRMSLEAFEEGLEMKKDEKPQKITISNIDDEKPTPELKIISIDGVPVKSEIVGVEP